MALLMVGLLKIIGLILLTTFGLALTTEYRPESLDARAEVLGYPVVSIKQMRPRGLIAIGQVDARGVLVISQLGFGVVAITQAGAGLLFMLGQVGGALVMIGQLGIGLLFFLGQVGGGIQAGGQGVFGRRPKQYLSSMSNELSELLSFRG